MTGTILKPSYIIYHTSGTLMWKPLSTRGCDTNIGMGQSWGVVSLIPRRWMQVVWVHAAIKAITSFPIQELGAREWTLQVFGFRFFLFMPNTIHKSICFLSRRFAEAWSSFTKSHLCCAMQLINPELSFVMKTPFKVSVISTLTELFICKIFLSLHHSASVKKEQDFNKWFLLASTFHNTERCLRSSSENPGMMLSLKTRSFQGH